MPSSKGRLNEIAVEVEKQAQESPKEEAKEHEGCPMCGAMVKQANPSKMEAFMKANPFKKK